MSDLWQEWGSDVPLSPTGGLTVVSGAEYGRQRVLRRLLTNPGDYIWHPDYGAGLARFIGQTLDARAIEALVREQMALETVVVQQPPPTVEVAPFLGGVSVSIEYVDAPSRELVALNFEVPQ